MTGSMFPGRKRPKDSGTGNKKAKQKKEQPESCFFVFTFFKDNRRESAEVKSGRGGKNE